MNIENGVYLKQIKATVDDLKNSQLTKQDLLAMLAAKDQQAQQQNKTWLEVFKENGQLIITVIKLTIGALIGYLIFSLKGGKPPGQ